MSAAELVSEPRVVEACRRQMSCSPGGLRLVCGCVPDFCMFFCILGSDVGSANVEPNAVVRVSMALLISSSVGEFLVV